MDKPRDCYTEVSQPEKEKYDIPYMWNLKRNDTNELTYKTERLIDLQNGLMVAGGGKGWREGIVREFGRDSYTLLYLKWINNKDLLYSTGNSARRYVAAWMGGEFGGECVCMLSRFNHV